MFLMSLCQKKHVFMSQREIYFALFIFPSRARVP